MSAKPVNKPAPKTGPTDRRRSGRRPTGEEVKLRDKTNEVDVLFFEEVEGPPRGKYISEAELRRKIGF